MNELELPEVYYAATNYELDVRYELKHDCINISEEKFDEAFRIFNTNNQFNENEIQYFAGCLFNPNPQKQKNVYTEYLSKVQYLIPNSIFSQYEDLVEIMFKTDTLEIDLKNSCLPESLKVISDVSNIKETIQINCEKEGMKNIVDSIFSFYPQNKKLPNIYITNSISEDVIKDHFSKSIYSKNPYIFITCSGKYLWPTILHEIQHAITYESDMLSDKEISLKGIIEESSRDVVDNITKKLLLKNDKCDKSKEAYQCAYELRKNIDIFMAAIYINISDKGCEKLSEKQKMERIQVYKEYCLSTEGKQVLNKYIKTISFNKLEYKVLNNIKKQLRNDIDITEDEIYALSRVSYVFNSQNNKTFYDELLSTYTELCVIDPMSYICTYIFSPFSNIFTTTTTTTTTVESTNNNVITVVLCVGAGVLVLVGGILYIKRKHSERNIVLDHNYNDIEGDVGVQLGQCGQWKNE